MKLHELAKKPASKQKLTTEQLKSIDKSVLKKTGIKCFSFFPADGNRYFHKDDLVFRCTLPPEEDDEHRLFVQQLLLDVALKCLEAEGAKGKQDGEMEVTASFRSTFNAERPLDDSLAGETLTLDIPVRLS
jgi:hypothetical protein